MRWSTLILLAFLVACAGYGSQVVWEEIKPAEAQTANRYDCEDFTYQDQAQRVYEQDPSDPYGLNALKLSHAKEEGGPQGLLSLPLR